MGPSNMGNPVVCCGVIGRALASHSGVRRFELQCGLLTTLRKYLYVMKKDGGSESTIIIGPSQSVLVQALHSLENVLGLARFRVFVPKLLYFYYYYTYIKI